MTRGRESNIAYVALDDADESHGRIPGEDVSVRDVLLKILANSGAETSAHQAIRDAQKTWGSIARMAAEYETIAAAGQHDRWATLVRASGLAGEQAEAAISSEAFGPLAAELRRAEANGHQVERLLPVVVARHGLDDADDVAAVLRHRVALATSQPRGRAPSRRLIVGLIPEALGQMAPDMRQALDERRDLIEQRARDLAADAVRTKVPWVRRLGEPPIDRRARGQWNQAVATLAAYRDRYAITSSHPLGDKATTDVQRLDRARAMLAQTRLQGASDARGRSASVDRGAMGI